MPEDQLDIDLCLECYHKPLVEGILLNMSKIEHELVLNDHIYSRKEFLERRLKYYEKLLREITGLKTLS